MQIYKFSSKCTYIWVVKWKRSKSMNAIKPAASVHGKEILPNLLTMHLFLILEFIFFFTSFENSTKRIIETFFFPSNNPSRILKFLIP